VKKNCFHTFFCSHKFHKIENYFIFEMLKKTFGPVFKEFDTKLSKIWVGIRDPGSGKKPIPDPVSGSRVEKGIISRIRIRNSVREVLLVLNCNDNFQIRGHLVKFNRLLR
jgi:hypothetical protein